MQHRTIGAITGVLGFAAGVAGAQQHVPMSNGAQTAAPANLAVPRIEHAS
jgi:hypothetical protein